jgi:hypothetical protein
MLVSGPKELKLSHRKLIAASVDSFVEMKRHI